jgi:hypothetical protein
VTVSMDDVVCLHTGSGGAIPATTPDAPTEVVTVLFGIYAMMPAADWLFSLAPVAAEVQLDPNAF